MDWQCGSSGRTTCVVNRSIVSEVKQSPIRRVNRRPSASCLQSKRHEDRLDWRIPTSDWIHRRRENNWPERWEDLSSPRIDDSISSRSTVRDVWLEYFERELTTAEVVNNIDHRRDRREEHSTDIESWVSVDDVVEWWKNSHRWNEEQSESIEDEREVRSDVLRCSTERSQTRDHLANDQAREKGIDD